MTMNPRSRKPPADGALVLTEFVPYRLAVLADLVSRALAQIYADRFDLTRHEWRVLAALAVHPSMLARDVAAYSALDKMSVSRAVATMEAKAYIVREDDPDDRRNKILRITRSGRALHEKIVPLVRAREDYMLGALTNADRQAFDRILSALTLRARELEERG
jgi:DNA-binding MarR family transcriptional regulator